MMEEISMNNIKKIFKSALNQDRREVITISSDAKQPTKIRKGGLNSSTGESETDSNSASKSSFKSQDRRLFNQDAKIREMIIKEGDNFWEKREFLEAVEEHIFIKNLYSYWSPDDRVVVKEVSLYNLGRAAGKNPPKFSNFF